MNEQAASWSLARRILFRFGVAVAVLQLLPFPFDSLPKMDWLTSRYALLWDWMTHAFGDLIGVIVPPAQETGSGDTTQAWMQALIQIVLGVVAAAIWSAIDERRRRTAYPRLARVVFTALRYWLAFVMFGYGFAKVFKTQFQTPSLGVLDRSLGEMSPMALLWTFMGYSTPYTVFGGLAECVGATLLLWRRTTTLGALVLMGVLANVVMLNFCYDVPVKIFSSTLLVVAFVLAFPDLRRIVAAILGHAVPARPVEARPSRRAAWIRGLVKLALVAVVVITQVMEQVDYLGQLAGRSTLHGTYEVETFTRDGVEVAPCTSDKERWRRLIVESTQAWIRTMADEVTFYQAQIDEAAHTLVLTRRDQTARFKYVRSGVDRLELDGISRERHVHIVLRARPLDAAPLLTRGFNWVQEFPYNR